MHWGGEALAGAGAEALSGAQGASRARETTAALARGPREFLVAVRRAGQFVGEMAAFASAAQRCASVVAAGPVRALVVPGEALRACVERVPEVRTLNKVQRGLAAGLAGSRQQGCCAHVGGVGRKAARARGARHTWCITALHVCMTRCCVRTTKSVVGPV